MGPVKCLGGVGKRVSLLCFQSAKNHPHARREEMMGEKKDNGYESGHRGLGGMRTEVCIASRTISHTVKGKEFCKKGADSGGGRCVHRVQHARIDVDRGGLCTDYPVEGKSAPKGRTAKVCCKGQAGGG